MNKLYALLENGVILEYPLTQNDIIERFPNTSFTLGELFLCPPGYVEVTRVSQPVITWNQTSKEVDPEFIDDVLTQKYEVTTFSPQQEAEYINTLKANKRQQINDWRLKANYTSFTYQGKEIATDQLSRSDIDGTNQEILNNGGQMPDPWVGGWKAIDNTWIPITTVEEWRNFTKAMFNQGIANFMKSQTLKAQLDSPECNTPELIDSIKWDEPEILPEQEEQ